MVGYRGIKPARVLFPFGHGLSYTSFKLGIPQLGQVKTDSKAKSIHVEVQVDVTNTGDRSGSQVVQCYVAPPKITGALVRAERELADFAKVSLEPKETKTVTLKLDRGAFSYWNTTRPGAWVVKAGTYKLQVGTSSVDIEHEVDVDIPENFTWKGL